MLPSAPASSSAGLGFFSCQRYPGITLSASLRVPAHWLFALTPRKTKAKLLRPSGRNVNRSIASSPCFPQKFMEALRRHDQTRGLHVTSRCIRTQSIIRCIPVRSQPSYTNTRSVIHLEASAAGPNPAKTDPLESRGRR